MIDNIFLFSPQKLLTILMNGNIDGLKEFLESSTIHGLNYISTSKTAISKLFWVSVIIAGFITAGVFIENSFISWRENLVATTIETLPIAKIRFPLINVCPPENTVTYMNYDLQKADNLLIANTAREALVKLAGEWLQNEEFKDSVEEQDRFKDDNKYLKRYQGYSKVVLAYTDYIQYYEMSTSTTAGMVSTPGFGEIFREDRFIRKVDYTYNVQLPANISDYGANISLVVDILLDTKTTIEYDSEFVRIYPPGSNKNEIFDSTGKMRMVRRYHITGNFTGNNNKLKILFLRYVYNSIEQRREKRISGMSVEWFVEDGATGDRVEIVAEDKYVTEDGNIQFTRLVNILHYGVNVQNVTMDEMWPHVKRLRSGWVDEVKEWKADKCGKGMFYTSIIDKYLQELESKLNMKDQSKSNPIYRHQVQATLLDTAGQMFLYLAYCDKSRIAKLTFYTDLIRYFSPRIIVQTILNINSRAAAQNNADYRFTEKLLSELTSWVQLDNRMIAVMSTSRSRLLASRQMATFYREVETCLENTVDNNTGNIDTICQIRMNKLGNYLIR